MYLYHIEFKSAYEHFEKIGITKYSPFKRFSKDNYLNYTLRVINILELDDSLCKLKEKELHNRFKEFKYTPLNEKFSGKTECFTPGCVYIES